MRKAIASILALALPLSSAHAIPQVLNFQGRVSESGSPINGTRQLTFRIYPAQSGGSALFEETRTVAVSSGIFNVLIGEATNGGVPVAVFDGSDRWVEVQVGAAVLPRQRVASVGHAFYAERAKSLADGVTTSSFTVYSLSAASATFTDHVRIVNRLSVGTGTIIVDSPSNSITFTNGAALIETAGGGGGPGPLTLRTGGSNSIFLSPGGAGTVSLTSGLDLTGAQPKTIAAAAPLTVTAGGANPLALNPAAGSGNVGVGVATPADKLHVVGQLRLDNDPLAGLEGCFRYNGTQLEFSNDCVTFQGFGAGGLGGTGTADRVPRFVNSTTLGDSEIFTDPLDGSIGLLGAPVALNGMPHVDLVGRPFPLSPASKGVVLRMLDYDIGYFTMEGRSLNQWRVATPNTAVQIDQDDATANLRVIYSASPGTGLITIDHQTRAELHFRGSADIRADSLAITKFSPGTLEPRLGVGTRGPLAMIHSAGTLRADGDAVMLGKLGVGTATPGAKLDIAGTPGVDGIRFPDGTLQTTAAGAQAGGWTDAGASVSLTDAADNVGIGAPAPDTKLHVAAAAPGAFKLVDTTQGSGRVLTSDANGLATWQPIAGVSRHYASITVPSSSNGNPTEFIVNANAFTPPLPAFGAVPVIEVQITAWNNHAPGGGASLSGANIQPGLVFNGQNPARGIFTNVQLGDRIRLTSICNTAAGGSGDTTFTLIAIR